MTTQIWIPIPTESWPARAARVFISGDGEIVVEISSSEIFRGTVDTLRQMIDLAKRTQELHATLTETK